MLAFIIGKPDNRYWLLRATQAGLEKVMLSSGKVFNLILLDWAHVIMEVSQLFLLINAEETEMVAFVNVIYMDGVSRVNEVLHSLGPEYQGFSGTLFRLY